MFQDTEKVTLLEYEGLSAEMLKMLTGINGQQWLHSLKLFLRGDNPYDLALWKPWATVLFGGSASYKDLKRTYQSCPLRIEESARGLFETMKLSANIYEAEIIIVTPKQLGLPANAPLRRINPRIQKLGFSVCAPEIMLSLAHTYGGKQSSLISIYETNHVQEYEVLSISNKKVEKLELKSDMTLVGQDRIVVVRKIRKYGSV